MFSLKEKRHPAFAVCPRHEAPSIVSLETWAGRFTNKEKSIAYIDRAIPKWSEDKEIDIDCLMNMPNETNINVDDVLNIVHKTIYTFFDIADDDSEEPMNEKDKLLLEVNKAICNNIKSFSSLESEKEHVVR